MMRKIFLFALVFITSYSFAQIMTQKVNPSDDFSSSKGMIYALPKTIIRLDVWVEKTQNIPGPYASYANRLLGLSEVITTKYNAFQISEVKISSKHLADPDQLYFINLGELSGKSDMKQFIQMDESGSFAGITGEVDDSQSEIVEQEVEIVQKGNKSFRYYADANLVDKVDTIIRRVDVDTATIEKAILKHTTIEKDLAQRAQDAATYFMSIRKNRIELISGFQEVAYSQGALQLMNQELKQMEDDYLALFAGKKVVSDEHYVFYYTPDPDQPNIMAPVFRFSKTEGLRSLIASTGEKVSLAIKSDGLSENLAEVKPKAAVKGVVVRFPETAEVWVKYGSQEFDKQLMQIPQLGRIQVLNMGTNAFELYPSSGGLKMLEIRK